MILLIFKKLSIRPFTTLTPTLKKRMPQKVQANLTWDTSFELRFEKPKSMKALSKIQDSLRISR